MTAIYKQHDAAFSRVSAFVVMKDGDAVARVALKFPADGAGRLYAYVHWLGTEMVRDFAGGYGYDKRSAAVAAALDKLAMGPSADISHYSTAEAETLEAFLKARVDMHSADWTRALEKAGFKVIQAV